MRVNQKEINYRSTVLAKFMQCDSEGFSKGDMQNIPFKEILANNAQN